MTVSGNKPCALTLPHKAPSVAISTGSGLTLRAEMPSSSRWVFQAVSSAKGAIDVLGQSSDDRPGERTRAHISQRFGIDDVIAMAGAQNFEEVETALRLGGSEPCKLSVADLGTEAIRGLVARARIVHRDPGGMRKSGPQHIMGFVQETLFAGDQQANDLPLGDQDPDPP